MEGYELTDRGKIVITVVLVFLLLFLPAAILLYTAMAGQPSQPSDDSDSQALVTPAPLTAETTQPPITESPPPNGGGFNPEGISPPANGQVYSRPPGSGYSSVDPVEGTLSFLFSPILHSKLNAEASSMLDEFLSSRKNIPNNIIAVETPQITHEDSEKLISVVGGALTGEYDKTAYERFGFLCDFVHACRK